MIKHNQLKPLALAPPSINEPASPPGRFKIDRTPIGESMMNASDEMTENTAIARVGRGIDTHANTSKLLSEYDADVTRGEEVHIPVGVVKEASREVSREPSREGKGRNAEQQEEDEQKVLDSMMNDYSAINIEVNEEAGGSK